jgi:hypothetical protein
MGASEIIKNSYQEVISGYADIDHYDWDRKEEMPEFSLKNFQKVVDEGKTGAVLYEGGGSVVILFINKPACLKFNRCFSLFLLEKAPGLVPKCNIAEIDNLQNKKFSEVMEKVFHDRGESIQITQPLFHANVLPFTQIDRKTSLPVIRKIINSKETDEKESISAESLRKWEAIDNISKETEDGKYADNLDQIVEKKGKESLMAIIYIDGNNIGQYVKNNLDEDALFEKGVMQRRSLTAKINNVFVNNAMSAIRAIFNKGEEGAQEEKIPNDRKETKILGMRQIVGAGDEITIICNARHVPIILNKYFEVIRDAGFSACAGVAVCHSHAPYAKVYAIAEECCQSGKNRRNAFQGDKNTEYNSYIEAYFCHSAITGSLATLRGRLAPEYSNMPYCISGCDEPDHMYEGKFLAIGKELRKISRTGVKALRDAAFRSKAEFEIELMRVKSNCSGMLNINTPDRTTFFDVAEFYDIWFREED